MKGMNAESAAPSLVLNSISLRPRFGTKASIAFYSVAAEGVGWWGEEWGDLGGTPASFFLPPLSLPLCLTSFIQSGTGGLHSGRARLSRTTAERCCRSLREGHLPSFLLKAAVLREAKKKNDEN